MTDALELALREHLDRHTAGPDTPAGPDLGRCLREGRRRRRHRAAGAGAAAFAVVAVLGTTAVAALDGDPSAPDPGRAADRRAQAAPVAPAGPTDFVAGTDVDDRFADLVADHWPALPEPDDVYPSDAATDGPLPDAEFGRATEWQAAYTLAPGHEVLVLMGLPVPGEDSATTCDGAGVPVARCRVEQEPAGSLLITQRYSTDAGETWFTSQVDADGFRVSVLDTAPDPERRLDDVRRVRGLVTDPRFTFEQGS